MATSKTEAQAQGKKDSANIEKRLTNLEAYVRKVVARLENLLGFDVNGDGKVGNVKTKLLLFLASAFVTSLCILTVFSAEQILWSARAPVGYDAFLVLEADDGTDANDTLELYIDATSNAFHIAIGGVDVMTVDTSGNLNANAIISGITNYNSDLILENGEIIDNGVDGTVQIRSDGVDEDLIFDLRSVKEGGTVTLRLASDDDDDVGDMFAFQSDNGTLNIQNDNSVAGTLATIMSIDSDGMITMANDATIDNDTSATTLTLTETTIALAGDVTVSGTLAATGVATFSAMPVLNAGVDINEDVDIDLNAADEEIAISQTAVAGPGDAGLIVIDDNRIGVTADGPNEATIHIDAVGVYAIGILDGAVAIQSVLETYEAATLILGPSTATKVEIADTAIETEIQGTLDVQEAASFSSTITLTDADGDATVSVIGYEGSDAILVLDADEGDDNADTWTIKSEATGNDLSFVNHTTEVMNLTSAGALQIDGTLTLGNGEVIGNAADTKVTITWDDDAAVLGELNLTSDNAHANLSDNDLIEVNFIADDSAGNVTEYGTIQSVITDVTTTEEDSSMVFKTVAAGSSVTPLSLIGLDTTVAGDLTVTKGIKLAYTAKTANYTNTVDDVVVTYNTSAATTNTLPDANTVLGHLFVISLQDDDGDLVVATDGTDTFDGTNDVITFADAGDAVGLMATAANVYTILWNTGGTLSAP